MKKYTYNTLKEAARLINMGLYQNAIDIIKSNSNYNVKNESRALTLEWHTTSFQAFIDSIKQGKITPTFNVFTEGNSKLPFLSFSSLPGKGFCPGAGDCLEYCYSFYSWKHIGAFYRQAQNSILCRHYFDVIAYELRRIISRGRLLRQSKIDFRLYVDGDFQTTTQLANWMELIRNTPRINAYGYSKSISLFNFLNRKSFEFPSNYMLNISSGGLLSEEDSHLLLGKIKKQNGESLVRGPFISVPLDKKSSSQVRTKQERKYISKWAKRNNMKKHFTCPGKCGQCLSIKVKGKKKNIHACGYSAFDGIPIIIPIH